MATYKARNAANTAWIDLATATGFTVRIGASFVNARTEGKLKGRDTAAWVNFPADLPTPTIVLSPASPLTDGTQNASYSRTFTAADGTAPYTYARTAGSLPPGLSLSVGGSLSGTPTVAGNYTFTITATDANGFTGAKEYALEINAAVVNISLSPSSLSDADEDEFFTRTISATGGEAPYTFARISGTLPPGMSLSSSGVYSGTPTTPGSYNFTIRATDANGATGSRTYEHDIDAVTAGISKIETATAFSTIVDISTNIAHARTDGFGGSGPAFGLWIDGPLMPYKGGDGNTYFIVPCSENYRFRVPDWDNGASWVLTPSGPSPGGAAYYSARQAAESAYNNRTWIFGPWAEGNNVWGLCHMEWYQTMVTVNGIPGFNGYADPAAQGNKRWVNSIEWIKSGNNGQSWAVKPTANSTRAVLIPEPWGTQSPEWLYGWFHPSNIVKEGSHYYAFVEARGKWINGASTTTTTPNANQLLEAGVVLIRTTNLDNATGWQFWNGSGWTSVNHSTYQGNLSSQRPYIFFRHTGWNPYTTSPQTSRMAQCIRWHIPTSQWLLFGHRGAGGTGFCYTRSATMANPQFESNPVGKVTLNHGSSGLYAGFGYISVFDPTADNSDNQNFMKIGNTPQCWVPRGQDEFRKQTLQISVT